jgi:hypothetical protein
MTAKQNMIKMDIEKGATIDSKSINDEAPGKIQLFWLLVWMVK